MDAPADPTAARTGGPRRCAGSGASAPPSSPSTSSPSGGRSSARRRRTIDLVGSLRLSLTVNYGSAFSLANGRGPLISLLALVIVAVLLRSGRNATRPAMAVAIGLVLGGAIGNLLDRAFRAGDGFLGGGVVDFVDLQWWPVFNVADAAIVVGAVLLFLAQWREDDAEARRGVPAVREVVPRALDGQRLDRVVALVTGCSRAEAAALVDGGAVVVGGRPVTAGRTGWPTATCSRSTVPEAPARAGLVADPGVAGAGRARGRRPAGGGQAGRPRGPPRRRAGAGHAGERPAGPLPGDRARWAGPDRPGIVHRLDKGTSGLLLVARSPAAYDALVGDAGPPRGRPALPGAGVGAVGVAPTGMVDAPIGRSGARPHPHGGRRRGKEAATRYEVIRTYHEPVEVTELGAGWRPGAPTRSGSTWRPSATRWWATAATAAPASRCPPLRGRSCTPSGWTSTTPSPASRWRSTSPLPDDLAAVLSVG